MYIHNNLFKLHTQREIAAAIQLWNRAAVSLFDIQRSLISRKKPYAAIGCIYSSMALFRRPHLLIRIFTIYFAAPVGRHRRNKILTNLPESGIHTNGYRHGSQFSAK